MLRLGIAITIAITTAGAQGSWTYQILHPADAAGSVAYGIRNGKIVGYVATHPAPCTASFSLPKQPALKTH